MDEIQLDSRKSYRHPRSPGAERAVDGGAHGGERERLGDHVVDQRVEAMGASAVMDGGGPDGGRRASRCRRDGSGQWRPAQMDHARTRRCDSARRAPSVPSRPARTVSPGRRSRNSDRRSALTIETMGRLSYASGRPLTNRKPLPAGRDTLISAGEPPGQGDYFGRSTKVGEGGKALSLL
jgi:hypothetical protein